MNAIDHVYRLATLEEWRNAQGTGIVPKRDIDRRDGYMHLSTREQALETARLHFADETDLLALEIPMSAVENDIKFELAPKRGEAFPHLYAPLRVGDVARAIRLERDGDGFSFREAL